MNRKAIKDALPFHLFMRRQKVLQLYRNMLRANQNITDQNLRLDLRAEIKREFQRGKSLTDAASINQSLTEGQRQLVMLRSLGDNSVSDGWLSSGEEHDKRGRVGQGWPWERS